METPTLQNGSPELVELIRHRIEASDGITFAEYMALALYQPDHGYYMTPRTRIGKEGDFFTSSSVHALFGRLVARQLHQMWELLGGGAFVVAEQGAGEGHLALDILNAVAEEFPDFYDQLRYMLVEVSPDNRRRQQALLAEHGDRTTWSAFEELAGFQGCFLSTELVDAFPVHLVERRGDELQEVYVVWTENGFAEELRPPSTGLVDEYFRRLGTQPGDGCRAEVNLAALDWMRRVAGLLQRGFVMTIDYGHPTVELYAPHRRNGTLMCYHRHCANEEPYQRVGCQDITAHVDFTSLQKVGEEVGLMPLYFGEQYRFLMGLGFVEELVALQAREPDPQRAQALRLTLKNLILPDGGMGETFKVLVQGKGVGVPGLRCARALRDIVLPGLA